MLVLSRKTGERILIGDDVVVTVVRIGPNSVRLGIEAPQSMNIVRDELSSGSSQPSREEPSSRDEDSSTASGSQRPTES